MTTVSITPPPVKERPIPFQADMMLANLNTKIGTWPAEPIDPLKAFKWQTRRTRGFEGINTTFEDWSLREVDNGTALFYITEYPEEGCTKVKCPYGKPGDRLWVREKWQVWSWREDYPIGIYYPADGFHDDSDSPDVSNCQLPTPTSGGACSSNSHGVL